MSETEFLTADELIDVTGYKLPRPQREWLDSNGWVYTLTGAGRPVVGRWFARLRMAGVKPTETGLQPTARPNFAALD